MTVRGHLNTMQCNAVTEAVLHQGLHAPDFEWRRAVIEELPSAYGDTVSLRHTVSGAAFFFALGATYETWSDNIFDDLRGHVRWKGRHCILYHPAPEVPVQRAMYIAWSEVIPHVIEWASVVKMESETPDLWELATSARPLLAPTSDENAVFSSAEQKAISESLNTLSAGDELKRLLSPEQLQAFRKQVPHWKRLSKKLGRIDWLNQFAGALIRLATGWALTREKAEAFLRACANAVGWLTEQIGRLPPIDPP